MHFLLRTVPLNTAEHRFSVFSPAPRKVVPRRDPPAPPAPSNTSSDDVDWKQLSIEFRQLLSPGALEPMEIHASYHHTFKKVGVARAGGKDSEMLCFSHGARRLRLCPDPTATLSRRRMRLLVRRGKLWRESLVGPRPQAKKSSRLVWDGG